MIKGSQGKISETTSHAIVGTLPKRLSPGKSVTEEIESQNFKSKILHSFEITYFLKYSDLSTP